MRVQKDAPGRDARRGLQRAEDVAGAARARLGAPAVPVPRAGRTAWSGSRGHARGQGCALEGRVAAGQRS